MLHIFKPKPKDQLVQEELADAERQLLQSQSGLEFAMAMVSYHTARINRLKQQLPPPALPAQPLRAVE